MARSIGPVRFLRRSVNYAVKGVRRGVGGAVRLAWPRKRCLTVEARGREASREVVPLNSRWFAVVDRSDFPEESHLQEGPGPRRSQALITVGSRTWGNWWDGRGLLKVKIYDFAIYADKHQAKKSTLSDVVKKRGIASLDPAFYRDLRSTSEIDMSLMVKASRNLPIRIMAGEYKRILKKRIEMVGGSTADPALQSLLTMFEEEKLPHQIKTRGNVKAGTVLTFRRYRDGVLTAQAGGTELGSVKSNDLCAALFDLYLGKNPVSRPARTMAGERVAEFMLTGDGRRSRKYVSDMRSPGGLVEGGAVEKAPQLCY
ncbi:hypothetical protein BSKO_04546 [Bryopsis sp. KO-2023]|nr:hypothetical protein BSKO_04546 [Bryopsis sp. KO-2023]